MIHEIVPKFAHLAPLLPVNGMHFLEWRKRLHSFDQMAIVNGMTLDLTGSGEPERIPAARASPNLFPMVGIHPQAGRLLLDEEDRPGHDDVVLITDDLWLRSEPRPSGSGPPAKEDIQPVTNPAVAPPSSLPVPASQPAFLPPCVNLTLGSPATAGCAARRATM